MKELILYKLSSRKLWALIISFITSIMIYRGAGAESIEKVVAMVGGFSSIVTYIFIQGINDNHIIDKE
jgi:hypothetical protein